MNTSASTILNSQERNLGNLIPCKTPMSQPSKSVCNLVSIQARIPCYGVDYCPYIARKKKEGTEITCKHFKNGVPIYIRIH